MFITAAIIIQALFWVLLGFLLSLYFIKKEDPVEHRLLFVGTQIPPRDENADQKILDVATEFYNDVNH